MVRQVRDQAYDAAIGLHDAGLGQAVRVREVALGSGVVAAFDVDGGLQPGDQRASRWLGKYGDVVDAGERGQDFGSFGLRDERPAGTFQGTGASVIIEAEDQEITELPRLLEVAHMTQVEQVETAVGEYAAFARLLPALHLGGELLAAMYFLLSIAAQLAHAMALINSSGVLLAQPRRRTTRAAAAFAR